MPLFLFLYFLIFGLFHFFLFLKFKIFLNFSLFGKIIYLLFVIIILFLPFIFRFFEKNEYFFFATIFSYIFYFWMAYLFIFNFFGIFFWIFGLIFNFKKFLDIILFAIPIFIIIFGFFEDKSLRVNYLNLESSKIERDIKIGFFSDLHIGLSKPEKKIEDIFKVFEKEKIDLLLCGGDLLDSTYFEKNHWKKYFKETNPPLGKYAVFGNHEWYVGFENSKKLFEELGFNILRFEFINLEGNIILAGAEEETAKYFKVGNYNEEEFLKNLPGEKFTIYLRHRPPKNVLKNVDLCLSGHTHRGQFFPFSLITSLIFKFHYGFYKIDNFSIYVSSGAGSWGPPVRFLSKRDVAIINLKAKGN